MSIDDNNNILISSEFEGEIDLDPGVGTDIRMSTSWGDNTFIVKLDNNGNYIWGNVFENTTSNQFILAYEMAVDNFGNILLAGEFQSNIDFDHGPSSFIMTGTGSTGFLLKLDPNGDFVWAKQFDGVQSNIFFSCITFDSLNNIIAGGSIRGFNSIDFNPSSSTFNLNTPTNPNNNSLFVLKLSENGDFNWVKSATGYSTTTMNSAGDRVHSIVIDQNDNIVFAGGFRNNIYFDTNSTSFALDSGTNGCETCSGYKTGYLAKMDSNGNMLWAKKIDGNNFVASFGNARFFEQHIVLDSNINGKVFLGYTFRGGIDYEIDNMPFNYSSGSINGWEASFFEIDPITGDYLSAHFVPSSAHTFIEKISLVDNDLYAVGSFSQQLFFDPNSSTTPAGLSDAYVVKFEDVTTLSTTNHFKAKLKVYPNPTNGLLHVNSSSIIENIEVFDILGRPFFTEKLNDTNYQMDFSEHQSGIYFIKIKSGNNFETRKVVKN